MHAHTAPALFRRPLDDADLANRAVEYGMRGFVLKDHDANTTGRAYYVAKMFPQVQPFGAIVLNRSVGGLNPYVAQAAIHYGARIVWMPCNWAPESCRDPGTPGRVGTNRREEVHRYPRELGALPARP